MQLLKGTLDAEIETEIVFDVGIIYSLFKCFAMFTTEQQWRACRGRRLGSGGKVQFTADVEQKECRSAGVVTSDQFAHDHTKPTPAFMFS